MAHTTRNHDGMTVLVVSDMNRRYDEEGKLTSSKKLDNLEIVHASEIAKYYNIPLRSIGTGRDAVKGIWALVHENEFGLRVPYNSEATKPGDRHIRQFQVVKDAGGQPTGQTIEKIINTTKHHKPGGQLEAMPLVDELDDGMYVKLADMLAYAAAMGWKKGAGRPSTHATAAHAADTNDKLDKLTDLVSGLAAIMAQQVVTAPAKK